ncbi:MAG: putative RecB family exonuclease [Acidimicrobiaceae bacterium]|jgi:putative RecB family exonuclease|nr:putative RecB family exonuclease [Acidimicrobiaceae bacterium]
MSLVLPTSLSPSKVASFKECALAFRYSAIDHLPEPPSPHAAKGTLVHRALQLLMWEEPAGRRSLPVALEKLERARDDVLGSDEYEGLDLGDETEAEFLADAETLVRNYFRLEDPDQVLVVGTELLLSVQVGSLTLRGIIDRLELDEAGEFVVTDYKTGRAPGEAYEQSRLGGVHFYAFLCEQVLGRRPARVQLLHLREPLAISTVPSEQSIRGLRQQTSAVWKAIELACERDDFRPKPGRLCGYCAYQAYCPALGGDPAAAAEAVVARRAAHEEAKAAAQALEQESSELSDFPITVTPDTVTPDTPDTPDTITDTPDTVTDTPVALVASPSAAALVGTTAGV